MDAAAIEGDDDTLYAELMPMLMPSASSSTRPGAGWAAWVLGRTGVERVALDAARARAIVAASRTATGHVAKSMHERHAFEQEIHTYADVLGAYGVADAARYTTLRPLRIVGIGRVIGLECGRGGNRYVLSARCETPLDRFTFARPADIDRFVPDVLSAFAKLHAGGMMHADVKLDNMIHCAEERRFKLIDWGASMRAPDQVMRVYALNAAPPRNTASPMAWFAYGVGSRLARAVFAYQNGRMHPRGFLTSPDYQRLILGAHSSYRRALDGLLAEVGGSEKRARELIVERHWRSFDLYSLGIVLAGIAIGTVGGGVRRRRLLALAVRLTHYDHPERVCDDAAAALRFWEASAVKMNRRRLAS